MSCCAGVSSHYVEQQRQQTSKPPPCHTPHRAAEPPRTSLSCVLEFAWLRDMATTHQCPPPTSTSLLPSIRSFLTCSSHPRRLLTARSHSSRPATSTGALLIIFSLADNVTSDRRPSLLVTHSTIMVNCASGTSSLTQSDAYVINNTITHLSHAECCSRASPDDVELHLRCLVLGPARASAPLGVVATAPAAVGRLAAQPAATTNPAGP